MGLQRPPVSFQNKQKAPLRGVLVRGRVWWPALESQVRTGEGRSHHWERAAGSSLLSGSTTTTARAHDGPGVVRERLPMDLNFS